MLKFMTVFWIMVLSCQWVFAAGVTPIKGLKLEGNADGNKNSITNLNSMAATNQIEIVGKTYDADVFLYHEGPADSSDLVVVRDFAQSSGTNTHMAFGVMSSEATLQSIFRAGVIKIPETAHKINSIQVQVYGTSADDTVNKVDVRLYNPKGIDVIDSDGLATTAAEGWTWQTIDVSSSWLFSGDYAGQCIPVRVREYAKNVTTSAVERVWKIRTGIPSLSLPLPLAHYLMNDNDENTATVLDHESEFNGLACRNTHLIHAAPKVGTGSLIFNNTDDYIDLGSSSSFDFPGPMSWTAWISPIDKGTTALGLISRLNSEGGSGYGQMFAINAVGVGGHPGYYNPNSSWVTFSTLSVHFGEWNFIAFSYDGVNMTCYVNGDSETQVVSAPGSQPSYHEYVGGSWYNTSQRFYGTMDDVRFYSSGLTPSQISWIRNGDTGTEADQP